MTFTIYHFLLYFAFLLSIDYSFVRKIFTWQYYVRFQISPKTTVTLAVAG